jgi:hypothetical protein
MKGYGIGSLMVIIMMLTFTLFEYVRPTDPTDKSWDKRSGMSHYVDHGTGCEYLSVENVFFGKGVLIKRLDAAGKHVCGKE